jgi:hypothetical protein
MIYAPGASKAQRCLCPEAVLKIIGLATSPEGLISAPVRRTSDVRSGVALGVSTAIIALKHWLN